MVCAVGTKVDERSLPRRAARLDAFLDVQDDSELPRERGLGFQWASSPGKRLSPVTETVASYGTAEDRVRCLVQAFSRECVSSFVTGRLLPR